MLIYLALGLLLVVAVHLLLSNVARSSPKALRSGAHWLFYGLLILATLFLLRLGLVHYAAILGFIGTMLALAQRAQTAHGFWHWLRGSREQQGDPSPRPPKMTEDEARAVLGVASDATDQQIQEAYRRLIRQNHPDQGGTEYLASQINLARDTLLNVKKRP